MTVVMLAFGGLVIWALVAIVRGFDRPRRPEEPQRRTPEQILAERFAAGEIDEEEYQRRRKVLSSSAP